MLAIGVDKHTTNKQAATMASLSTATKGLENTLAQKINSHNGLENKQPQWLRK